MITFNKQKVNWKRSQKQPTMFLLGLCSCQTPSWGKGILEMTHQFTKNRCMNIYKDVIFGKLKNLIKNNLMIVEQNWQCVSSLDVKIIMDKKKKWMWPTLFINGVVSLTVNLVVPLIKETDPSALVTILTRGGCKGRLRGLQWPTSIVSLAVDAIIMSWVVIFRQVQNSNHLNQLLKWE